MLAAVAPSTIPAERTHAIRDGPIEVAFRVGRSDEGRVVVEVFDVAGRRVETLVDQDLAAGRYRATWNGGGAVPGVYFVRLSAGSHREVRKLVRVDR